MQRRGRRMNRKGLTGIETAIILIAFVIVASVFAFAVLNLGMTGTQKTQSVVSVGVKQASSALQIQGHVLAYGDEDAKTVNATMVFLNLAPGQEPIDFNAEKMVITYKNDRVVDIDVYNDSETGFKARGSDSWDGSNVAAVLEDNTDVKCFVLEVQGDGDMLLEPGETFLVVLDLDVIGESAVLMPYDNFAIEIKPQVGSTLTIQRTIPASITAIMDLG